MSQNISSIVEQMDNNEILTLKNRNRAFLLAVAMLIPIYIGRMTEFKLFYSLGIGKYAVFLVFFVLFFSQKETTNKLATFWSIPQIRYLIYFFLLNIISFPFSLWLKMGFDTVLGFSKLLVFTFLIVLSVKDRKDLDALIWVLMLTVFGLVLYSFISPEIVEGSRITVPISYDPNDFALLIVITFALGYYFLNKNKGLKKVLLLVILLSMCFALMRTASRGGILAFTMVILAIQLKQGLLRTLILLPIIAIAITFLMMLAGQQYYERFTTLFHTENDYNVTDKSGRIDVWKHGLKIMIEHPLVGVGPGNFAIAEGAEHEFGKWSAAHNSFIEIGTDLGIPGLVVFLLMIASAIKSMRKNKDPGTAWLSNGLEVGFYGFCVGGFFLSWGYSYMLYFLVALAAAVVRLTGSVATVENG